MPSRTLRAGQNIGNGDDFATLEARHRTFDSGAIGPFRESVGKQMDEQAPIKFANPGPMECDGSVIIGNGFCGLL